MGWFWANHTLPIGVDLAGDGLRLIQLKQTGSGVRLIAGRSVPRPDTIPLGSAEWQHWAIQAIHEAMADRRFKGRKVIAAMPASDVYIDLLRAPKVDHAGLERAVLTRIENRLPFDPANALVRCLPAENDHVIAVATNRTMIDRHLAIYEKAALMLNSICIWPVALANCYTRFFGRRQSDLQAVVLLLDIEPACANVVICRHKNLLLARSTPLGTNDLHDEKALNRLVLELNACRHQFAAAYKNTRIERLIFVSGQAVDAALCAEIARQLDMRAQMGDCLRAVTAADVFKCGIDRRSSNINWATAFGLSLSQ